MTENDRSADIAALLEIERRRCEALGAGDVTALAGVLGADYRHVHANGLVEPLDVYLEGAAQRPRSVSRGDIEFRFRGDVAEMLGEQTNRFADRTSKVTVYQTAVRAGGQWRFTTSVVVRREA